MNRRIVLKNLALFSGSVLFLPSCLQSREKKASVVLKNLKVTADQEATLAELAETIIPATDSAGAKALGLPYFVWMMVDDCYGKEQQQAFMHGLDQFNEMAREESGHSFVACGQKQRNRLLEKMAAKNAGPRLLGFYNIVKKEVIKGYLNSKLVMTKFRKYEMVPGRYNGYFPVQSKT